MSDQEQGSVAMGCVSLVVLGLMASCVFGGDADESVKEAVKPAQTQQAAAPAVPAKVTKPAEPNIYDEPLVRKAQALSEMNGGSGDAVGLLLNLQGELCADVVSVTAHKKKHRYDIICIENRDGSGWARYTFDAADGTATLVKRTG